MTEIPIMRRDALMRALGNDIVLVAAFEQQQQVVQEVSTNSGQQVEATQAIQDATVITLSANEAFGNERIFTPENGVEMQDDGSLLRVRVDETVARVSGAGGATLIITGTTTVILPTVGTLATLSGTEILSNKTLNAPKLAGLGNYANDAAAAAGGVPVDGVYRNGSVVMVRVT